MKTILENKEYNTKLEASDWRFSASIVGLVKYFEYHQYDFEKKNDYILYNYENIEKEKYLDFAENFFRTDMHHINLIKSIEELEMFKKECENNEGIEKTEDEIKKIKKRKDELEKNARDFLNGNTVMKKVFKGYKLETTSKETFKRLIEEDRYLLIEDTFKNGKRLYSKFINQNKFFQEEGKICRLRGYSVDEGRKTRCLSYYYNTDTFSGEECKEFDFIPFAFTRTRESFFINNNFNVKGLLDSHSSISTAKDSTEMEEKAYSPRAMMFSYTENSTSFIEYNVEVITNVTGDEYYETKFIRKEAIECFKKIKYYNSFQVPYKSTSMGWLDIEKIVTQSVINQNNLDSLILSILKENRSRESLIGNLIYVNILLYKEGDSMEENTKKAYGVAKTISAIFTKEKKGNKLTSYKTKLITALIVGDYDKFNEILLKLSNQAGIELNFAYDLFEDFEKNKNQAFTFVNALQENTYVKKEEA